MNVSIEFSEEYGFAKRGRMRYTLLVSGKNGTRRWIMKKLTMLQLLAVASMLFGMFFGAGNLIFPAAMGQLAGSSVWLACAGLLITGVGLPLLGVAALGVSRADGLLELSSRVGRRYGLFFTCAKGPLLF